MVKKVIPKKHHPATARRHVAHHPVEDEQEVNEASAAEPEPEPVAPRKGKVMGTVTWLGEGEGGAEETSIFNRAFKKGEAVEIEDENVLQRLSGNKYFEVEGYEAVDARVPTSSVTFVPLTSQAPPRGPVEKPGEPLAQDTAHEPNETLSNARSKMKFKF